MDESVRDQILADAERRGKTPFLYVSECAIILTEEHEGLKYDTARNSISVACWRTKNEEGEYRPLKSWTPRFSGGITHVDLQSFLEWKEGYKPRGDGETDEA